MVSNKIGGDMYENLKKLSNAFLDYPIGHGLYKLQCGCKMFRRKLFSNIKKSFPIKTFSSNKSIMK